MAHKKSEKINRLEALWREEDERPELRSLAERISLVSRALHTLPPEEHAGWGKRAAQCLLDAEKIIDPYAPAGVCKINDEEPINPYLSTSHSNERHSLSHSLAALLPKVGSVDASMEALAELGRQGAVGEKSKFHHARKFAQDLANEALVRLSEAGRHEEMALLVANPNIGFERRVMEKMLHHEASAFEHPAIMKRARQALAEEHKENQRSRYLGEAFEYESFMVASNGWQDLMMSAFDKKAPSRVEVDNLAKLAIRARRVSQMSEEMKQKRHEQWNKERPNTKFVLNIGSYPRKDREIAHNFELRIFDRFWSAMKALAQSSPAEAARAALAYSRADLPSAWGKMGLSTVSAIDFLYAPDLGPDRGQALRARESFMWPISSEAPPAELAGVELNAMDCLLLSSGSAEELENLGRQGFRLSKGIQTIMESKALGSRFSAQKSLWITSMMANPAPALAKPAKRL